jgi:hypothetical protein
MASQDCAVGNAIGTALSRALIRAVSCSTSQRAAQKPNRHANILCQSPADAAMNPATTTAIRKSMLAPTHSAGRGIRRRDAGSTRGRRRRTGRAGRQLYRRSLFQASMQTCLSPLVILRTGFGTRQSSARCSSMRSTSCIARSCCATHRQAFKQPSTKPAISKASDQGCAPG